MTKKMMTLALVACCGWAAQADTLGSVDFQGRAIGTFVPTDPDIKGETARWVRSGDTGNSEVVWGDEISTGVTNKYLVVDETGILSRSICDADGSSVAIPEYGGIVISNKVQFTALESDETDPEIASGQKIALWLKRTVTDEATNYNFVVRANKIIGDGFYATNYVLTVDNLSENKWYDLEVTAQQTEYNSKKYTAFTIKIDGTEVEAPNGEVFWSLVPTANKTITSVGLSGTGAVDDFVFSKYEVEAPEKEVEFDLSIPEEFEVADIYWGFDEDELSLYDGQTTNRLMSTITKLTVHAEQEGYITTNIVYTKEELQELVVKNAVTVPVTMQPIWANQAKLVISPVNYCTIVVSNGTEQIESGKVFNADEATVLTVYRTPASGYELNGYAAVEEITMDQNRTVTAAVKVAGSTKYPDWIDDLDTTNQGKYTTWAESKGVSDPKTASQEAFLLNCGNTSEEIAAAEKEFKMVSITIDSDGNVTLVGPDASLYNGQVTIRGAVTVDGTYNLEETDKTARFFKAFLEYVDANGE